MPVAVRISDEHKRFLFEHFVEQKAQEWTNSMAKERLNFYLTEYPALVDLQVSECNSSVSLGWFKGFSTTRLGDSGEIMLATCWCSITFQEIWLMLRV